MPPPERLLQTVRRAIELVRSTPGRSGHLVRIGSGTDMLVVGDLHGHVPNFQTIWKRADLANHPGRHLVLQELIHSPFKYPNGGDKSHQMVDLFAAVKCQYPDRVHFLPGNHEMGQWTGRKILKGDADLNEQFRLGVLTAYGKAIMPEIYKAYIDLFQACPLGIKTPNHVFISHSIIPGRHLPMFDAAQLEQDTYQPRDLEPGGVVYGMLWGRDASEETAKEFARKVDVDLLVTGHLPADEGYTTPNTRQVSVDCAGSPGGYVLFPIDRPISYEELKAGIVVI